MNEKLKICLQEVKTLAALLKMVKLFYSRDENDWRDAIRSLGDWDNCGDAYVLMKLSFEEYGGEGNRLIPNKDYSPGLDAWKKGKKYLAKWFGIYASGEQYGGTRTPDTAAFDTVGKLYDVMRVAWKGWAEDWKPHNRQEGIDGAKKLIETSITLCGEDSTRIAKVADLEENGVDRAMITRAKQYLGALLRGSGGQYVCEVMLQSFVFHNSIVLFERILKRWEIFVNLWK